MDSHYNLGKYCKKCKVPIINKSKTGYCNHHRDRTGNNNPFYGKRHKKETIEKLKIKLSIISKNLWKNKEYAARVILGVSKPRRDGFKKEQSNRVKRWYKDNPIQLEIRSKAMKKAWDEGKIEPNINSINESRLEKELRKKLKKMLSDRNVIKRTIKIGRRWFYPDVSIDKNILIEFFGNYWHANPKRYKPDDMVHHGFTARQIWTRDKDRVEILRDNGFRVFIVWQDEYENDKINSINNLINSL